MIMLNLFKYLSEYYLIHDLLIFGKYLHGFIEILGSHLHILFMLREFFYS